MPTGYEVTMDLLIKAIQQDEELQSLFSVNMTGQQGQRGTVKVYFNEPPPTITYPFIFLAEATESTDLRDSESDSGEGDYVEMLRTHCLCWATSGDFAWKCIRRIRHMLIPNLQEGESPSPVLTADPTNNPDDIYDIQGLAESRQNLLPTNTKSELGMKVLQSTQTFLLYSKKKGSV